MPQEPRAHQRKAAVKPAKQPQTKTCGCRPRSRPRIIRPASLVGVVDNLATNDRGDDLGIEDLVLGHGKDIL